MSIKYDEKNGKLFQTDIAASTLEKDNIDYSQLCEKLGGKTIKLDSITSTSVNIFDFDPVYEISGEGRYLFVEKLKEITDVEVMEEHGESILVSVRTHRDSITSMEEVTKLFNSMEQSLAIVRIN